VRNPSSPSFDVTRYSASVEPDIEEKTIRAHETIAFTSLDDDLREVVFDCGELTVDSVLDRTRAVHFEQHDHRLYVRFVAAPGRGQQRRLTIAYHGAPRRGLLFDAAASRATTVFATSEWLICIDAPSERAAFDLTIVVPRGLRGVGNGRLISERDRPDQRVAFTWRQDRPMPSYLYGFAVGRFEQAAEKSGSLGLRYFGEGFSIDQLQTIFRETARTIRFFEDRAGVRYADTTYSQVLAGNGIGQEMSSFALIPESYGRSVLSSGDGGGLGTHELAHQWWGNLVTCADWTEFWLNEGFATYMVAAYFEARSGRDAYLKQIEVFRSRFEKVKKAGHDRPLVFPDWNHPTADDRTIVYQKGAYFLHVLRESIGDQAFWTGIRQYTVKHAGGSVTSADFQKAMESASGRDLSSLFAEWVYPKRP
jgi:aminopeptidase N